MVKKEEDWFEEELVYEFIDIQETGNYHDKHCEFDLDKHPERRELYNMMQFAYYIWKMIKDGKSMKEHVELFLMILMIQLKIGKNILKPSLKLQ